MNSYNKEFTRSRKRTIGRIKGQGQRKDNVSIRNCFGRVL